MDGWHLVIGGSGGIGAACARRLARDGRRTVVTYRSEPGRAAAVVADIMAAGGRAEALSLSLPGGQLGSVDGLRTLVWALGADIGQPYVADLEPADLVAAVDIELHGFAEVLTQALPALRASSGSVVTVSSAGIRRHPPGDILSTAPKAAVEAMVRAVAREEGRHGVRANTVAVGVVDAGIFRRLAFDERWQDTARRRIPLRRFGAAEDVANAVAWLASEEASYVTGQVIAVDGGYGV